MGHQAHFLRRLDRITTPQVDFALSLYRDHELVRFILANVRIPENEERFAISIGDPVRGPFLIVTRQGRFVTCLGEGMSPGQAYVITRRQVEAVAQRHTLIRARWAAYKDASRGEGGAHRLVQRMFDGGDELTREELIALSANAPGMRPKLVDIASRKAVWLATTRPTIVDAMRRADKMRPYMTPLLRLYHKNHWVTVNFFVLFSVDLKNDMLAFPAELVDSIRGLVSAVGFHSASVGAALRGTHCLASLGQPLVPGFKHQYASATNLFDFAEAVLTLTAIGLRYKGLRAEIRRALAGPTPLASHEAAEVRDYVHEVNRLSEMAFDAPAHCLRLHRDAGARRAVAISATRKPGASGRFDRPEDVPEDLALPLAARSEADFLADLKIVRDLFVMVPWLAQADAADLFVPQRYAAATHRSWTEERTLRLLRGFRDIEQERAAAEAKREGPARKAPCPCGSGEKYKRCCANKAIVAAPRAEHEMAEAAE